MIRDVGMCLLGRALRCASHVASSTEEGEGAGRLLPMRAVVVMEKCADELLWMSKSLGIACPMYKVYIDGRDKVGETKGSRRGAL